MIKRDKEERRRQTYEVCKTWLRPQLLYFSHITHASFLLSWSEELLFKRRREENLTLQFSASLLSVFSSCPPPLSWSFPIPCCCLKENRNSTVQEELYQHHMKAGKRWNFLWQKRRARTHETDQTRGWTCITCHLYVTTCIKRIIIIQQQNKQKSPPSKKKKLKQLLLRFDCVLKLHCEIMPGC